MKIDIATTATYEELTEALMRLAERLESGEAETLDLRAAVRLIRGIAKQIADRASSGYATHNPLLVAWWRRVEDGNSCGNAKHPNGPWHPAAPIPWTLRDRVIQWWRRQRYGCGCPLIKEEYMEGEK